MAGSGSTAVEVRQRWHENVVYSHLLGFGKIGYYSNNNEVENQYLINTHGIPQSVAAGSKLFGSKFQNQFVAFLHRHTPDRQRWKNMPRLLITVLEFAVARSINARFVIIYRAATASILMYIACNE